MREKIGLAIITKQPRDTFPEAFDFWHHMVDHVVVVNDGDEFTYDWSGGFRNKYVGRFPETTLTYIKNPENLGVATSKNKAMQQLLDQGCDHIFIMEDDMRIIDNQIFQAYIDASKKSGIQHLMFGYHGPANKNGISHGKPCPRLVVDYGDLSLAFNQHCVGAFCYYSRKALEDVGLIDEKFRNAFDHVSHSYELALKGYSTPYWWWADLANSLDYIEEQACSEENSSIKTPESMQKWEDNIRGSMDYFKEKFGVFPFGSDGVPDTIEQEILTFLKNVRHENRP
jgi:glycosyltransferase involved in cell wall biosynthesis